MRLGLLELEPRDTPSPADLGGGVVRVRTGWEVVAFDGWAGQLQVIDGGADVTVGAGDGGGPRVAVFDKASGLRLSDRFVGDPDSRHGAALVPVDRPTGGREPLPTLDAGDPAGFPVFVAYEGDPTPAFLRESFAAAAAVYAGLPVRWTTTRPAGPPGEYGVVVVGAPTTSVHDGVFGYSSVLWDRSPGLLVDQPVYVGAGLSAGYTGLVMAHEAGHALGLPHKPRTVMDAGGELVPGLDADQRAAVVGFLHGP